MATIETLMRTYRETSRMMELLLLLPSWRECFWNGGILHQHSLFAAAALLPCHAMRMAGTEMLHVIPFFVTMRALEVRCGSSFVGIARQTRSRANSNSS